MIKEKKAVEFIHWLMIEKYTWKRKIYLKKKKRKKKEEQYKLINDILVVLEQTPSAIVYYNYL